MFERIVIPMFKYILGHASPEIRKSIVDFVNQLEVKAKATTNEIDDMLVMFLKAALDI